MTTDMRQAGGPEATTLVFGGEDEVETGPHGRVRRRRFDVDGHGRRVPGLLWTPPEAEGPRPLVLVGHGGSHHKRQDYVVSLARVLVGRHAMAVAAIDGPVHGDRRSDGVTEGPVVFLQFAGAWAGDAGMTDAMVADWQATLSALRELPEVGRGPVGWWGVSMGTILGLPFVAAEPAVDAAVFGLMGATGPTRDRIVADAPAVGCPVLFLVQWDDQLFPRASAFELFDLLGTSDKRLHAHPGGHGDVPDEAFAASIAFLARRLQPAGGPPPGR